MNSELRQRLKDLVSNFPVTAGVYLMKNQVGKIIYVGKAKNLKNRVRSYLNDGDLSTKTRYLVKSIFSIEYITTQTEVEAFLLEATLIKKHRPRYNIRLRDDKAYPYIRLTLYQDFPRFYLSRRVSKDGSLYFGPFTRGGDVWQTIRFLNRHFQIRDCSDTFMKSRSRPCMTHQIGRCRAPCVDLVTKSEYRHDVENAILFLRGQGEQLSKDLKKKMVLASKEERFEEAARWRDSLQAVDSVLSQQSVVEEGVVTDQDIIGYYGDARGYVIEILHLRRGRVVSSQPHFLDPPEDLREWFLSFVNLYYLDNVVPDEVITPMDLGNDLNRLLKDLLIERRRGTVTVTDKGEIEKGDKNERPLLVRFPTNQKSSQLLGLAERNAQESFKQVMSQRDERQKGLQDIKDKLQLPNLPRKMECYDISHFQGDETVAALVVFEDGRPAKDQYRKFKIQSVEKPDDFQSMRETLTRRFKKTEWEDPDLVVIDGGKGQLNIAIEVLKELGKELIPVVGIAKARTESSFQREEVRSSEERFFLPGRQNPILFSRNSSALQILASLRDEAHRFAISFHRSLRDKSTLESRLDSISGLGEKRKKMLLDRFGSVQGIRDAGIDALASLRGISRILAESIILALSTEDVEDRT